LLPKVGLINDFVSENEGGYSDKNEHKKTISTPDFGSIVTQAMNSKKKSIFSHTKKKSFEIEGIQDFLF